MDISRDIIRAYEHFRDVPRSIEEVFALDGEVRSFVRGKRG
jgi:hypothetical protein